MNQIFRVMAALVIITASITAYSSDYELGAGDIIAIQVYGEDDLTFERLRLDERGGFSFPFLNYIDAKGLKLQELEKQLVNRLKGDYLINPRITIRVLQYRNIYINGEVARPGGFPFEPGLTLRKAIALAGGFSERASRSKISVVGEDGGRRKNISEDAVVNPGDVVTVGESIF